MFVVLSVPDVLNCVALSIVVEPEDAAVLSEENNLRLALPGDGELNLSAADGPVGDCKGSEHRKN